MGGIGVRDAPLSEGKALMGFDILALLTGILQPGLAGYALRLHRLFGSKRVGWWVFYTFAALALLHAVHLLHSGGVAFGVTDVLISGLLLAGMAHTESVVSGRVRLEQREDELLSELERAFQQTEELTTANANLLQQVLQREQKDKLLRASEEQLRFVFERNPQPMWIFDLRTMRFLAFNEAALRQYGFTPAELMVRTARDLYAEENVPAFLQDCLKPSSASETPRLWQQRRKDGTRLRVEIRTMDLRYDNCPARLVLPVVWQDVKEETKSFRRESKA